MDALVDPKPPSPAAGRRGWLDLTPINRRRLDAFKRRAIEIPATYGPLEELAKRGVNQTRHGRSVVEAVPDK